MTDARGRLPCSAPLGAWTPPALSQAIDATTYPFTFGGGGVLEDMSSGTTQLIGPDLDNAVSAVTPIGFEFWFAGVRYTNFSVSSNVLLKPGNVVTRREDQPPAAGDAAGAAPPRLPQMPAYHLVRGDRAGITMVNIGVGPANARTITDHIAVLRPHAWIMLGHCAGLRTTQQLGDYVLAHGYMREDHVLDDDLPIWVPIPALAEVQVALEQAVAEVTGLSGFELKKIMRTGTVATIDNRNWELREASGPVARLSQARAIALDMESATIAANGFRFRVPYGTLLCVSDRPLHGELKLPGMATAFYRRQVHQHLEIGIRALEKLRAMPPERLHSRKLRSFSETAFQ